MADSHRIASRDGVPFDFSDGLKIAGFLLSGNDGGKAIKVLIKDTDTTPTDLYTWARSVAAAVATLQATSVTATTAVNQAAGNNSTLIANTAFVTAAVAAAITQIVAAAPANMNTLQELAAAIGNDPAYSTTVNTLLASKVSLAQMQASAPMFAVATAASTVDAIAATFTPAVASNVAGLHFIVRTKGGNTSISPTFTPNPGVVPVKTIVKGTGLQLQPADIGLFAVLQYDPSADAYVLLNPNYAPNVVLGTAATFGVVQLASNAEVTAGASTTKVCTPAGVNAAIQAAVNSVAAVFRAPTLTTPVAYHEKGAAYVVNMTAAPISPDTSIVRFEVTMDGFPVIVANATANAASVSIAASGVANLPIYSSYQLTVVAIGNTGTRSPSSVLAVTVSGVNKPSITFPAANARGVSVTPTFTSSAFSVLVGTDTHASSGWEITDSSNNVIWSIPASTVDKTAYTVPANVLEQGQTYKVRVRHFGTAFTRGSEWSDPLTFATVQVASTAFTTLNILNTSTTALFGTAVAMSDTGFVVGSGPNYSSITGLLCSWYHPTSGSPFLSNGVRVGLGIPAASGMAMCMSRDGSRIASASPLWNGGLGRIDIYTQTAPSGVLFITPLLNFQMNDIAVSTTSACALACNATMTMLAVGSPGIDNGATVGSGCVTVWRTDGANVWQKETVIHPENTLTQNFGEKVAMDDTGEWLAVTAAGDVGKLFLYRRMGYGWSLMQTFSPDAVSTQAMPVSFNAAGTRLVLGSPSAANSFGGVYIYDLVNGQWENTQIWYDTNPTNGSLSEFGASVAMSADGNVILIGCPAADIGGYTNLGKVSVLRNAAGIWVQDSADIAPQAPSRVNSLRFGGAGVAINTDGTLAVIGNPNGFLVAGQSAHLVFTSL